MSNAEYQQPKNNNKKKKQLRSMSMMLSLDFDNCVEQKKMFGHVFPMRLILELLMLMNQHDLSMLVLK
jgi:cAMP phosphodiesterase